MVFKVAENSLFAVLSRSPWWYSAVVGLVSIAIGAAVFDGQYLVFGIFGALPFFGISAYAIYKTSQKPSRKRVLEVAEQSQKMSADKLAGMIANSYISERFDSVEFKGSAANLELTRGHRKILLATKRFKAGNTGVEPLKQLVAAGDDVEATGYLYVALGKISDSARQYAENNRIELIQAVELAALIDGKAHIS